ncbi:hypothetical protein DY000_02052422 [Brassica cretica]|uniref:Pinin/SDK/MemA protein domain-containing protein n=1 Tax=Brassica cretica TaxID=69181 RepID=A0ABQ7A9B5_BRACR|nr:hypothetical protein DY000_02052422 [Brassica cretica]
MTPGETTPSRTTPGETTHSGPPPLAISPGPSVGPINIESSREDFVQSSERETAETSMTAGNKKKRSAPDSSASIDAQARTGSDEPPKKKKKKEKKKRKKSIERQSEPVGDSEGHKPVVHEGSPREAANRAVVESSGSPNVPLEKKKKPSSEAAIDKAAAEQSRLLADKKSQKEKFMERFGELKDKFKNAGEKIRGLEREKAALEKEKAALEERRVATALRHLKEVNRLRDSRSYEVTHERVRVQTAMVVKSNHRFAKIRDLEKRRGDFETARSLQSQAFGTKRCLEALKESGIDIPQETIDLCAEQEKEFEAEAKRLTVGGIPEELLCLSLLHLPSTFLNENVLAAINPYGSNTGEISVSRLFRSTRSLAGLKGPGMKLHHLYWTTSSMANLVVSEESLIPILGVIDANPTLLLGVEEAGSGPVDLLELSDSSAEEEGGEKSDDRIPGDNPHGTEEGGVDEVENPPASTTNEAGGASDQLEPRVAAEDLDRVEN